MLRRIFAATAMSWMITTPRSVAAQTVVTTITFSIPLNLTRLSPDLARVRLVCAILPGGSLVYSKYENDAISTFDVNALPKADLPVVGGQVQATLSVDYPIWDGWLKSGISGSTNQYECRLQGFSMASQSWDFFSATPKDPSFLLTPAPAPIKGSINW